MNARPRFRSHHWPRRLTARPFPSITAQADRWTGWARMLAGRHRRRSERRAGLPMTQLGRARVRTVASAGRWVRLSQTVAPRIGLTVRPSVVHATHRQVIVQQGAGLVVSADTSSRASMVARSARAVLVRSFPSATTVQRTEVRAVPILRRVVERLSLRADRVVRAEVPRARASAEVVRRVVHGRRRVEADGLGRPMRQPPVVRPRSGAAPAAEPVRQQPSVRPETRPAAEADRGVPYPPATAVPALEVAALTDHVVREIDARRLAHRERMGRPF